MGPDVLLREETVLQDRLRRPPRSIRRGICRSRGRLHLRRALGTEARARWIPSILRHRQRGGDRRRPDTPIHRHMEAERSRRRVQVVLQ